MAYLSNEEEKDVNNQPGSTVGGTAITGGSVRPAMGNTESGSWTNLNRYLELNQPQAQRMAQNISTDIGTQREQYGKNVQEQRGLYEGYLQGLVDKDRERLGWAQNVRAGETPTIEDIRQRAASNYFGTSTAPQEMDVGELTSEQKKLQDRLDATAKEAGRIQELKRFQTPDTTRGETLLNQLLLQGNPEAKDILAKQRALGTMYNPQYEGGYSAPGVERYQQELPGMMKKEISTGLAKSEANKAANTQQMKNFQRELSGWQSAYNSAYPSIRQREFERLYDLYTKKGIANPLEAADAKATELADGLTRSVVGNEPSQSDFVTTNFDPARLAALQEIMKYFD